MVYLRGKAYKHRAGTFVYFVSFFVLVLLLCLPFSYVCYSWCVTVKYIYCLTARITRPGAAGRVCTLAHQIERSSSSSSSSGNGSVRVRFDSFLDKAHLYSRFCPGSAMLHIIQDYDQ